MSLLRRLFPREVSGVAIDRIARGLPVSGGPGEGAALRCLARSARLPGMACDAMGYSLWQDKHTGQIWIHCTGGFANADLWYGPGDAALAKELGADVSGAS